MTIAATGGTVVPDDGTDGDDSTVTPPSDGTTMALTLGGKFTSFTDGMTLLEDVSVSGSGTEDSNTVYDSYKITLSGSGSHKVYVDGLYNLRVQYMAIVHKQTDGTVTRYRKSDNNLPTVDNPLSVSGGDTLWFTMTKAMAPYFVVLTDYVATSTQDIAYSTITQDTAGVTVTENAVLDDTGSTTSSTTYDTYDYTITATGNIYLIAKEGTAFLGVKSGNYWYRMRDSQSNLPTASSPMQIASGTTVRVSTTSTFEVYLAIDA